MNYLDNTVNPIEQEYSNQYNDTPYHRTSNSYELLHLDSTCENKWSKIQAQSAKHQNPIQNNLGMWNNFNTMDFIKQWEEPRGVHDLMSNEISDTEKKEISPLHQLMEGDIIHQALAMANAVTCDECGGMFTESNNPEIFPHCGHMACSWCFRQSYNYCGGLCSQCLGFDLNGTALNQFNETNYFDLPQLGSLGSSTWNDTLDDATAPEIDDIDTSSGVSSMESPPSSDLDIYQWTLPNDPEACKDNVDKLFSDILKNNTTDISSSADGNNSPTSAKNGEIVPESQTNTNSTIGNPSPEPPLTPEPITIDISKDDEDNLPETPENLELKPTFISQSKDKVTYAFGQQVEFVVEKEEPVYAGSPKKQLVKYNIIADSFTVTETSGKAQSQSTHQIKPKKVQRQLKTKRPAVRSEISKIKNKNQRIASKLNSESSIPTVIISTNGSKQTLKNLQRKRGGFQPIASQPKLVGLTTSSTPSPQGTLTPGQYYPAANSSTVLYVPNLAQLFNVTPEMWKSFSQISQSSAVTTITNSTSKSISH